MPGKLLVLGIPHPCQAQGREGWAYGARQAPRFHTWQQWLRGLPAWLTAFTVQLVQESSH